jgi:transcriptional regulator GlxA family with amidase domain
MIAGARTTTRDYAHALSIIAVRVADQHLTPTSVAAEMNTTMRTLQRQFSARGTTVNRSIRAARVALAQVLLEDPAYRSLTVSQVAQACGMRDGTTLARAFAQENLAPPATVRTAARRPA